MHNQRVLPEFLHHIYEGNDKPNRIYNEASWLRSDFDDLKWCVQFGRSKFYIDFRIKIAPGQMLTSERHRDLLRLLKSWLCMQDHSDVVGHRMHISRYQSRRLTRTLLRPCHPKPYPPLQVWCISFHRHPQKTRVQRKVDFPPAGQTNTLAVPQHPKLKPSNRADSLFALVGLLEEVISSGLAKTDARKFIIAALSSQGELAKFGDSNRGIEPCSLNTLKKTAEIWLTVTAFCQ